jgi:hypothetical protein
VKDGRYLLEQVGLCEIEPGQRIITDTPTTVSTPAMLGGSDDSLVWRVREWMPECPPHVDPNKWAAVLRQLEAIHSVLEEAGQEHLRPEAVSNLLNEAVISSRKLGVEAEVTITALRRKAAA